jgi:ParB-like chromosome segregation protein Spo0J
MRFRRWLFSPVLDRLRWFGHSLYDLQQEQRKIMTNLSDIAADVATIKQDVATVATVVAEEVADLRAQLAAAIANQDPAALQAVHDGLGDVHTSLTAIAAANAPAPAPTPDPAPVDAPPADTPAP